ncbi:replication-relaxation family protein [Streptomyces chartreusis]|uniref:replication-relaxation family protein n=1 Tax=Streptomyces chartreusis TaxID=1969 RepID=UPI00367DFF4B
MISVDAGSGDRLALRVLAQYRMASSEQMHRAIAPGVRIEQTRRRLARLRAEGLVGRIAPSAGRADPGVVPDLVRCAARLRVARDARAPALQDRPIRPPCG